MCISTPNYILYVFQLMCNILYSNNNQAIHIHALKANKSIYVFTSVRTCLIFMTSQNASERGLFNNIVFKRQFVGERTL